MKPQPRLSCSLSAPLSRRFVGITALFAIGVLLISWFSPNVLAQSATVALPGHLPKQVEDGSATPTGHYNSEQMIRLTIGLQTLHPAEEEQFLQELQTKSSPQFHKYLTADQWNARFAPSVQDEQAVVNWAQSQGLTVTHRFPHRLLVDVEGTMGTIEKALNVTMNSYQIGTTSYFSNDRNPQIPASLNGIVHDIEGLNNIQVMHPSMPDATPLASPIYAPGAPEAPGTSAHADGNHALLVKAIAAHQKNSNGATSNITNGNYDPTDIYNSNAYDYNALQALGHCCNPNSNPGSSPPEASIAIATFGDIAGSDITGFHDQYLYPAYNYNTYYIDGTPACCNNESAFVAANRHPGQVGYSSSSP
jgi:subtilase family serine protease